MVKSTSGARTVSSTIVPRPRLPQLKVIVPRLKAQRSMEPLCRIHAPLPVVPYVACTSVAPEDVDSEQEDVERLCILSGSMVHIVTLAGSQGVCVRWN